MTKPLTLQEAKEKCAQEAYDCSYMQALSFMSKGDVIDLHDKIARAYSLSCQKALREKIASEAKLIEFSNPNNALCRYAVDRSSILNTPLIQ